MTNQYTVEAVSGAVSLPAFTLDSRNKLLSLDRGEVIRPHAGRLPVLSTEPQPTSKLALRPESLRPGASQVSQHISSFGPA